MKETWKVSLHGGHSGDYCDHAEGTLRELLEAAVAFGYHTFGVSEHVPRFGAQYLYDKEKELGWTVEKITDDFARYTQDLQPLVTEFADRLIVLRGFEAEVVPPDDYVPRMRAFRDQQRPDGQPAFDYFVGSVHFVNDHSIDGPRELFDRAIESCGGLWELIETYFHQVAAMVENLKPDVVGHFDLVKLNILRSPDLQSEFGWVGDEPGEAAQSAAFRAGLRALEAIRDNRCLLDLNTAGWRKGLQEPYPGEFWTLRAHKMEIPFCFGDDSHRVSQIGAGVVEARQYLLRLGIKTITVLTRERDSGNGPVVRRVISLV